MPEVVKFGSDSPSGGFQIMGEKDVIDPGLGHVLGIDRGLVVMRIQISTHEKIREGISLGDLIDPVSEGLGILQPVGLHLLGRGS